MQKSTNIEDTVLSCFKSLIGQPIWGGAHSYGSWISFEIGEPKRLDIVHPDPDSTIEWRRTSRLVTPRSAINIFIDMCHWSVRERNTERWHSESEAEEIENALTYLNGQLLINIRISIDEVNSVFTFDLGGSLTCNRYNNANPENCLWHLYYDEQCLSFREDGKFEYGKADVPEPKSYVCASKNIVIRSESAA